MYPNVHSSNVHNSRTVEGAEMPFPTSEWMKKMSYVYTHTHTHTAHIFFIHSSVDGHLGSFHSLAIVDIVSINIQVYVRLQITTFVSLG